MRAFLLMVLACLAAWPEGATAASTPPLRIWPLGDSITYGLGIDGGYRLPLYQLLTNAGYRVEYVGTQTANGAASLPDPDHDGYVGYRIDQVDAILDNLLSTIPDPDVVLLLLGTNDYGQGYDTDHTIDRLESLVGRIAGLAPYAKIVVANLLVRGEAVDVPIQATFNPYVSAMVDRQRTLGREVFFDDLRSSMLLSDTLDELHPNATGYAKIATNWFGTITNLFSPEGSTNPPAIAKVTARVSLTNVTVHFSKPVAEESARPANFALSGGVAVLGAALDTASLRQITLTTSPQEPSTSYALTVNGVTDRTREQHAIAPNATARFVSANGRGALRNVPEAAYYTLVYALDIPDVANYATGVVYQVDQRATVGEFTRVAYYLELQTNGQPFQFLWVSMAAFTTNVNWIGVPTLASGASFQQSVDDMSVVSSVAGIVTGEHLTGGNLEFWPVNTSPLNAAQVPNASNSAYDWGDNRSPGNYGSMQVHNHAARQVLFAFNGWGGPQRVADLGIGNRPGNYLDWTLAQNANTYAIKTLQVYVLPKTLPAVALQGRLLNGDRIQLNWSAVAGGSYSVYRAPLTNLSAWTKVGTVTATGATAEFSDLLSFDIGACYRVTSP